MFYSPKESSLKNSSSGSYCFVAILLVLFGNFETPTTCAFIVVSGGGAYFAVCRASAKFLMGTQNHEFSHPYSFSLTENSGGD